MKKNLPIYFIHGYKGTPENFGELKKYFPTAIDIPLPWHLEIHNNTQHNRDFLMKYLKNIITEKSLLIGHSLGGLLAQEFSIKYPELVEKVIFLGYPLDNNCAAFKKTKKMALSHRKKNTIQLKRYDNNNTILGKFLFNLLFFLPQYKRQSIQKYFMVPGKIRADIFEYLIQYNDPERIKQIKIPVILINGTNDVYNKTVSKNFDTLGKSYIIPRMSHQFFAFENKIADIIHDNI